MANKISPRNHPHRFHFIYVKIKKIQEVKKSSFVASELILRLNNQFFGGSGISPSPPVPTASGNNAHMMYIFNRNGICLLYREWNCPLRTLNSNQDHKLMLGLLFSLKSLTAKMDPSRPLHILPNPYWTIRILKEEKQVTLSSARSLAASSTPPNRACLWTIKMVQASHRNMWKNSVGA